MSWPIRRHICTTCRTLFDPGEGDRCACGYAIVDASHPHGYGWLSQYPPGPPPPPKLVAEPRRGVVRATGVLPSPIGRYPVVGYAVDFPGDHGRGSVMRDASCLAFDLVDDDGRQVMHVPAGRMLLANAPGAIFDLPGMVQSFIRARSRWDPVAPDAFPSMRALEYVLFHGARVEIHSGVIQRPDPNGMAGYREVAMIDVAGPIPFIAVIG